MPPPPPENPSPLFSSRRLYSVRAIFLITLLGAILRLTFITQPALWGDETLTYSRVCGSYRQLIDILQRDGFVPLHYELYWLIARVFYLTPAVMRTVPILAGILLVPAIYFLARQLVNRQTANLAALLTACSAFMLVYSRDAKMYPHFWLFAVLMMAFYLRWLQSPTRLLWLAWIACGVAAVGLQTLGLALVGLMPLFLLTSPQVHWKKTLCLLIGILVITAGPAGYYLKFNRLIQRSEEETFNEASGTRWVRAYNQGRSGPDHLLYCATAFLYSWEWPRDADQPQIDPDTLFYYQTAGIALIASLALGALPWRRLRRIAPEDSLQHFPDPDPNPPPDPSPWPKTFFYLSAWIILPAYIFYCRSMPAFATPRDWINTFADLFARRWLPFSLCVVAATILLSLRRGRGILTLIFLSILILLLNLSLPLPTSTFHRLIASALLLAIPLLFIAAGNNTRDRLIKFAGFSLATAIILLLCQACSAAMDKSPDGSVWIPRYLGIIWPAFIIAVSILIMRLPTRALRWSVIALFLLVNLTRFTERVMLNFNIDDNGHLLITGCEPPIDLMASDIVNSDTLRREPVGDHTISWKPRSTTRTCVFYERPPIGSPGNGNILSNPGRYYLAELGQTPLTPQQFRTMPPLNRRSYFYDLNQDLSPRTIAAETAAAPTLTRLIIWDRLPSFPPNPATADPYLPLLGPRWTLTSTQTFQTRQHWLDTDLGTYRRREYNTIQPLSQK